MEIEIFTDCFWYVCIQKQKAFQFDGLPVFEWISNHFVEKERNCFRHFGIGLRLASSFPFLCNKVFQIIR